MEKLPGNQDTKTDEPWSVRVVNWADARNIFEGSTDRQQFAKLLEEMTELYTEIQAGERDADKLADAVGDCCVVLCIIATFHGISFESCLERAWNDIKDRKGKMIRGVFVKNAE